MIWVVLQDLRWKLLALLPVALVFYALEPGFHQHDGFDADAIMLGPLGISAAIAHFAAVSMIVLFGGVVSGDRREGYARLYFSHPTSPFAYYALRWGMAYLLSLLGALVFLVVGQIVAWGAMPGGFSGMLLPALTALIYGGLVAFLSVTLSRGDTWVAFFLLLIPTFFPQIVSLTLSRATPLARDAVAILLPPLQALESVWNGLVLGDADWVAAAWAAGYGLVFLVAAGLILRVREWP